MLWTPASDNCAKMALTASRSFITAAFATWVSSASRFFGDNAGLFFTTVSLSARTAVDFCLKLFFIWAIFSNPARDRFLRWVILARSAILGFQRERVFFQIESLQGRIKLMALRLSPV